MIDRPEKLEEKSKVIDIEEDEDLVEVQVAIQKNGHCKSQKLKI